METCVSCGFQCRHNKMPQRQIYRKWVWMIVLYTIFLVWYFEELVTQQILNFAMSNRKHVDTNTKFAHKHLSDIYMKRDAVKHYIALGEQLIIWIIWRKKQHIIDQIWTPSTNVASHPLFHFKKIQEFTQVQTKTN